jgi:hypothetical protein
MSPHTFPSGTQPGLSRQARRWGARATLALLVVAVAGSAFSQDAAPRSPFKVTVRDEKAVVSEEASAPLDPTPHIRYQPNGMGVQVNTENGQTLHLSHFPTFSINGQISQGQPPGQYQFINRPLPRGKGRKDRQGFESCLVSGDLRITCTVSLTPTKPTTKGAGAKRRLDSVLVEYLVENKGTRAHKVGVRIYMDTYVINNDGCLFAAPTKPGMILDGVILKGKEFPPYLQMLQIPNLKNPGFVSHMTFDLGSKREKPERVVLTRHGAGGAFGGWDMPAMQAMGDSGIGVFWEPKNIPPGGKREMVYAYGQGVAISPESEGLVKLALGGSFAPGKAFDVTAYVIDPPQGQSLTLELPPGMALVEGPRTQPVPETPGEEPYSLVRWRARVLRPGEFPLRVRSSTGVTQAKTVTVTPAAK